MLRNNDYVKKYQICYEITIGLRNRGEKGKKEPFLFLLYIAL